MTTGLLVPTTAQASASAPNTGSTVAQESADAKPEAAAGLYYYGTFPSYDTCHSAGLALEARRIVVFSICTPAQRPGFYDLRGIPNTPTG